MKQKLLFALGLAAGGLAAAVHAAVPAITGHTSNPEFLVSLPFEPAPDQPEAKPFLEMPPSIQAGTWRGYIVSGYESFNCVAPWGLLDPVKSPAAACSQVQKPLVDDSRNPDKFGPEHAYANIAPWRRNYYGIYHSFLTPGRGSGNMVLGITHGENKGEYPHAGANRSTFFPNSIAPNMQNTVGDTSKGCFEANGCYFAFVGGTWLPYTEEQRWGQNVYWDMGPIVWPSQGYVSDDGLTKISNGPRHPNALMVDGYVYVFYVDHIYKTPKDTNANLDYGDRRSGVKLVRAPLPVTSPAGFMAYFNGKFQEPALPSGFQADSGTNAGNMMAYLSTPGPRATPLFGRADDKGTAETISFAVAQVRNKRLFVGLEQYYDWGAEDARTCAEGQMRLALRMSEDLVNWSRRTNITPCVDGSRFRFFYPKFMDKNSWSNTLIDLDDFYVLGTANNERSDKGLKMYALQMALTVDANPAPALTVVDDTITTTLGQKVAVDVRANDGTSTTPASELTLVTLTQPYTGSVTRDPASRNIIYTPSDRTTPYTTTFTYTVRDAKGNTATGKATVKVNLAALVAKNDTLSTQLGKKVAFDVTANDGDATTPAANLQLVSFTQPDKGTIRKHKNSQNLVYRPLASGEAYTTTFTYTVADANNPNRTATGKVTIQVSK